MTNIEKIIKEFDKNFYEGERNSVYCREHELLASPKEIKAFLLSSLTQIRQETLEEIERIDPVWLAEAFHDFYESYAKLKGWNTQEKTKVPFADLPKENKETMICTASSVLIEIQGKLIQSKKENI